MGKDRTPSQPVSAVPPAVVLGPDGKPQRPPKGHRQNGAGTVITAKPPVVTGDGIVLKTHERLPSQLLSEFCQREKRPNPKYFSNPPGRRMKVVLEDTKNSKNDLNFCPNQSFQSDSIARDFAALLALFHFQKTLPLERKMPEPYSTTWLTMITNDRIESAAVAQSKQGNGKASSATMETETKKVSSLSVASSNVSNTATTSAGKQPVEVLVPVLDRNTSDWLCDSCGNSNFATLASGALRTKCFRCQCAKSATCVLVAPSSGTPAPPAFTASSASAKSSKVSSNSNSSTAAATNKVSSASNSTPNTNSNSGPKLKVAPAAVANLKVDKAFVSKQDEEKAKLESTAAKRRRAAYFDALKRANKPMPVYVSQTLRKMLENVLGLNKTSLNDAEDDEEGACLTMEAFLSDYSELITFSEELCLVTAETQLDLLREVVAGLRKKGFQERDIVRCLQLLLLTQYSEEIIETIDSTLQSKSNNTSLSTSDLTDTSPIRAVFVAVITEACLSQLCIQLDEASLPAAFDPSAAQKKLVFDVYKPPAVKGGEELSPEAAQVVSVLQTSGWSRKDSVAAIEVAKSVAGSVASEDDLLYASRLVLSLATYLRRCNNGSEANNPTSLAQTIAEMTSRSTSSEFSASRSSSAGIEVLLEECESLEAIFGDKFSSRKVEYEGGVAYHVLSLEVDLCGATSSAKGKQLLKGMYTMTAYISCSAGDGGPYPNSLPLIVLHSDADSLSIPQQVALTELQCAVYNKASAEFLGECMLFQVYSFLTDSVDAILAAATSSASAPSFSTELVRVADYVNSQCSGDALAALFNTADDSTTVEGDMSEMSVGGSSVSSSGGGGRSNPKNKGNHPFWVRSTDKQNRFANSSNSSGNSNKTRSANYNAMQTVRRALPAWNMRDDFLSLMSANRGLVVTGETGCGKTTQIPQFIHETQPDAKIVVCQPRRLAAIGVATRIADEMDEAVGDTVGYMVKGDSKATGKTKIVFCTYGVLLRRLQDDPTLRGIDYVILDEVHERGIDSDFTLALLMSAAAQRADLRVMLMSATIATERFAAYLASGLKIPNVPSVPVMFIPGFTFPVTEYYKGDYEDLVRGYRSGGGSNRNDEDDDGGREGGGRGGGRDGDRLGGKMRKGDIDYDLLVKLIMALCSSSPGSGSSAPRKGSVNSGNDGSDGVDVGAMMCRAQGSILVFVPGVPEINRVSSLLQTSYNPRVSNDALNMRVMPLHGNLSPSDQRRVFQPAGRGEIKVIVATNVAEASITIPDVSVVIDTCRVKEMGYNVELQTSALMMKFAAQDSLLQRRGRAGRVSHGRCFRLVTRGTYEKLPAHGLPEILRSPLDNVILQIKAMLLHMPECGSSDSMFILSKCLDSPEESVVRISEQALVKIQALDPVNFALTPLGKHLSTLPCDPRVGRLLIYGALLGCVYPASCVAACMTARSPFLTSAEPEIQQKVNNAKAYFAEGCSVKSDYNVIVKALRQFESSGQRGQRSFCMQYGLSYDRMAEIRQSQSDLLQGLVDIGFLSSVREAVDSYSATNNSSSSSNSSRGSGSNRNAHKSKLVAAVYCAGLYPQLAKVLRPPKRFVEVMGSAIERNLEAKELKMYIPDQLVLETSAPVAGGANIGPDVKDHYFATNVDIDVSAMTRVFLHPSTVNFSNTSFRASNFMLYGERQLVTYPGSTEYKLFLRDTTEVTAFALLFFGGKLETQYMDSIVTIDGWIRFSATGRIVALVQAIRRAFDQLLEDRITHSGDSSDFSASPILDVTCRLLETDGLG